METIRWGIIGCGDVTEVKSGPGFQKATGSSLSMVMRRNGALAQDYAARHHVPRWTDDADALIHDPQVDAIYIATPPSSHKEHTLAAARAGKPVYVEKPMALSHADCLEMIEACQAADVPLFVAYYRRALPRFVKIKELVDGGAIGDVRYLTIELSQRPPEAPIPAEALPWRLRPEISGGGHFVDLACHTLDFLDFLLGPVARAHGAASNQGGFYPAEDMVSAELVFQSGVHAVGTWCFSSFTPVDRVTLVGSRSSLEFATFANQPLRLTTSQGSQEFTIDHPPHIQQPLIQQIVDELRGLETCVSHGGSAARTTWVMEEILRNRRTQVPSPP